MTETKVFFIRQLMTGHGMVIENPVGSGMMMAVYEPEPGEECSTDPPKNLPITKSPVAILQPGEWFAVPLNALKWMEVPSCWLAEVERLQAELANQLG
jgi:hypothetical protein